MRFAMGFIRRLLLLIVLAGLMGGLGAYQYFSKWLEQPMSLPAGGLVYHLEGGSSLSHLAQQLATQGVLTHPEALVFYARLTGQTQVRAGDYQLTSGMAPGDLLGMLTSGDVVRYSVTLVEGQTFADFVSVLADEPRINAALAGKTPEEQLAILDLPIDHLEGWFFPDTYQYVGGDTDIAILHRAYQRMAATLNSLWEERAENLPYSSSYEALIMASIVERETGAGWERRKISGVFVRRLQNNMRLQTDPTVIYGMGAAYQGKIGRADLRAPTPYNTYVNSGLPPTPIAMPGAEAIYAALHPESGADLYFVARGDGTHVFSQTLEDHNAAVREFQLKRKSDYRSTIYQPGPEAQGGDSAAEQ